MILNDIFEFTISGVQERGIPNQERIAIKVNQTTNTGQFGVMIGSMPFGQQLATPFNDHMFWFGDGILNAGDWIFLYTCPGTPFISDLPDGKKLYSVYWNKPATIFATTDIVPILFKVDAVQLAQQPQNALQLTSA